MVRFLRLFEDEHQRIFSLEELRIIHDLRATGSASHTELSQSLSMTPATIRNITARLVELGICETRGAGRNRRFHLTARFYDLAEDRNAYIRIHAMDTMQQEQMILSYARSYGSITRAQTAQLCQITPNRARELLKNLVARGDLLLQGERRTAHYVLPQGK